MTDPRLVQMFLFERCFDHIPYRPLPINTPLGLARILAPLPEGVTHVVFDPNGVTPRTETVESLVRLLKTATVQSETLDF